MDLSEQQYLASVEASLRRGLKAFEVPEPMSLEEWARKHFYLSAESSYVEQEWVPWWFQRPILAVISNDDVREVILRKSARVGATKIILAAIGYFAQHKRRNQIIWQPTDEDRDEFVKSELDPMLRDVKIMQSVFPAYLRRDKDNTLQQKKFRGSMTHMKGGKAAKNYRRVSVDNGYLDEYDAFDDNIEKEGDPGTLASKRVEGATFPKMVFASTPKLDGFSNIQKRERAADISMTPQLPCPECGEYHALTFGGKDEPHGFKWTDGNPDTVRHLCPHCGTLITQAQYLAAADTGRGLYRAEDGTTLDAWGVFRDAAGNIIRAPERVALVGVWSAYSPNVLWSGLVREFLEATKEAAEGKKQKLQTFVNTTKGDYWGEDYEQTDDSELQGRAEPYRQGSVPRGCLLLGAAIDTQTNRLECAVWGWGRGCERWPIEHRIFFGNPDEDEVWSDLDEYLFETDFPHASGRKLRIAAAAIDTGGQNTHAVYSWCAKHNKRKVFAIKGRSHREKHIKDGTTSVDIDWRGRRRKNGLLLWWVGTNMAKDVLHSSLQIRKPGPGYIHFSDDFSDEWFKQFTAEARTTRRTANGGEESAWTKRRNRNEAWDCATYMIWLEVQLGLDKKKPQFWDELEALVQPANGDLFIDSPETDTPKPTAVPRPAGAPRSTQAGSTDRSNLFQPIDLQ
jgi:phage terminase large subunit GpA-like protein